MADPYEPDRPVMCPYDNTHRIAQSRIQKHLVKCSKNFPPNYKITCPFNATHRLFESELTKHIFECPDQQYVDGRVYDLTRYHNHGSIKSCHDMEDRSVIVCDESWDEEEDDLGIESPNVSVCRFAGAMLPNANQIPSFSMSNEPVNLKTVNRPPRGRPATLMMEESGDSTLEDIESVLSCAGMGRGKPCFKGNTELLKHIGRGRGSCQPKN